MAFDDDRDTDFVPARHVEALDLGEASRDAVMARIKPAIPLVAGAVILLLVLRSLRGGGGSSGGSSGGGSGRPEIILRF